MTLLAILLFVIFLWLIHENSLLLASSLSQYFLLLFLGMVALVIPTGYLLSAFNALGNKLIWSLSLMLLGLLLNFLIRFYCETRRRSISILWQESRKKYVSMWERSSLTQKAIFILLGFGLLLTSCINLIVLFITFPNEWDSMTGHLVKCAYYLQNGNMERLQGTSWSIDFYPNSLPTLQIFGYHLFGEKGFKFIHYFSYWIYVLSTYGITKIIFRTDRGALFVALIAAVLPSALIQAVTTETDIVQSAYLGLVIYFALLAYKKATWQHLIFLVLAISIWMSHKVTFLLIGPAIAILVVYLLYKSLDLRKKLLPTLGFLLIGIAIYVLPNGYIANVKEVGKFSLGALSAPAEVMEWHGISNYTGAEKLKNFELNILRYSSDFFHLDGLRNTSLGALLNEGFRVLPNQLLEKFHLERDQFWVVYPFETMGNDQMHFYKERPYWGIISFTLVIPVIVMILLYRRKSDRSRKLALLFVAAGIIHFLSLCYSAPYDPIKGRYFMNMAVWFLPLLAWYFRRGKGMSYILLLSFIICISAFFTLSHRGLYPLFGKTNVFEMERIPQLTITRPESTGAYLKFEELVPADAIVALGTQQEHEDYIYPLWGKNFTRKLIPIHPFRSDVKPIPEEAEYLFYSEGVIPFEEGDILLGLGDQSADTPVPESKFFLRNLKL